MKVQECAVEGVWGSDQEEAGITAAHWPEFSHMEAEHYRPAVLPGGKGNWTRGTQYSLLQCLGKF